MNNSHYNKNLREFAVELRTETVSKSEKYLWKALKQKQQGVGFKRQRPISYFIVDFFSDEIGLIIEIDGNSHFSKPEYDRKRQDRLESLGYTILRFSEGEVWNNRDEVLVKIQHAIHCLKEQNSENPPPAPSKGGVG
jgi:very-short-patch-repair endonuclease